MVLKKFVYIATLLGLAITFFSSPRANAIAAATFTISPSGSSSVTKNALVSFTLKENSGSIGVNAVQTDLSYDASKLDFVSVDTTTSAFDVATQAKGGAGKVSVQRGKLNAPLTGNQIIATVSFKALSSSGVAALAFSDSSAILSASNSKDIWNHAEVATNISFQEAGTPADNISVDSKTGPSTSANSGTSKAQTYGTDVTTNKGYLVAIRVLDAQNKPLFGIPVTLNKAETTTDSTGLASFYNVPAGTYTASAKGKDHTGSQEITIAEGDYATVQQFDLPTKKPLNILFIALIAIPVIAACLFLLRMLLRKLHRGSKLGNSEATIFDGTEHTHRIGEPAATKTTSSIPWTTNSLDAAEPNNEGDETPSGTPPTPPQGQV